MSAKRVDEPPHLCADLRALKLPTIGSQWQRLAAIAAKERQPHPEYLADLMHLELTDRTERRIQRRIKEARFPSLRTLDGFDFTAQPQLDREQILDLARSDFVKERSNVILIGEVGTGKTHLATALAMAACQRGYRTLFTTSAGICTALVEAKADDRLSRKMAQLARFDLVVLDELGYVPFDRVGADLLFGFIARMYEQRSLIVTTNLPFSRWNEVFLDATAAAAVIDRVAHHATILKTEGKSYRLREAQAKQASEKTKSTA